MDDSQFFGFSPAVTAGRTSICFQLECQDWEMLAFRFAAKCIWHLVISSCQWHGVICAPLPEDYVRQFYIQLSPDSLLYCPAPVEIGLKRGYNRVELVYWRGKLRTGSL